MPAKGWRKENGKKDYIGIRIGDETRQKLDYICEKMGWSYTEMITNHINEFYYYVKQNNNNVKTR